MTTGPGRLYAGIQRQQIRLEGNISNGLGNSNDFIAAGLHVQHYHAHLADVVVATFDRLSSGIGQFDHLPG